MNNLLTVTQNGTGVGQCGPAGGNCFQTRTFNYNSLSRLTSATNPESGTINYIYDNNGNLTSKTDARNITTSYSYDAVNRVTNRIYTNEPSGSETSDVAYFYDNVTNAKGKLTKVSSSVSTTEYVAFDILGRVTRSKQVTDGVTYGDDVNPMTYSYNLAGALIEQKYPSGRAVKNVLENDGDLAIVQSKKNAASGFFNYAKHFAYAASGAVTSMQLGNGRWESTQFNSRLQPTQIALGTVQNGTDKLDLDYTYGTTNNNSNVLTQTINFIGLSHPFVQTYNYDELNRLKNATETYNSTQTWKQTFTFDRYGNRRFDFTSGNTTVPASSCIEAICNPTISTSNNRLTSTGYNYDSGGNTTYDAALRKFTYDAENKQTKAELTNSSQQVTGTLGEYFYDGDGRRIKKIAGNEVTIFVYDAGGKLVAEYSTTVALTENAKVGYLTTDHLGSPRLNTDRDGAVSARHDYHPFGEEIATSQRTSALGYPTNGDSVSKQFTGYERDDETDLDFAEGRFFATSHGRFTTVDPISQTSPINPQTLNKYAYAINSPYRFVDRSGKWPTEIHNLIFLLSLPGLSKQEMARMQDGSYSVDMPKTVLGYYANQHGMCKPSQGSFECAIGVFFAPTKDLGKFAGVSDTLSKHCYFGRASHGLQDIPSPAHGFQVYDDKNFLACSLSLGSNLVACALYAKEALDHAEKEAVITQTQLDNLIQVQRQYYKALFGEDALKRGVGVFGSGRFLFDGPIDGRSLPTWWADDLGVVTVYPDGRQEYKGPLEKK